MNYAEYKTAKSFNEVIKDGGKHLYELYVLNEKGFSPKRYLCTISIRNDGWRLVIFFKPYDKFGREIHGWHLPFGVSFCNHENEFMKSSLESDVLKKQGYKVFALSRDSAYKHCIGTLRSKMQELRKKEVELHNAIFNYDI